MRRLICVVALVVMPAQAQFYSGNELWQIMQADDYTSKGMALGFVAGVSDSWDGTLVCGPSSVTLGQAVDIVKRFLRDNPQSRHLSAESLARVALARAWPCRKGSGS